MTKVARQVFQHLSIVLKYGTGINRAMQDQILVFVLLLILIILNEPQLFKSRFWLVKAERLCLSVGACK